MVRLMSAPEQWLPSYLSLPRHPKTKRLQRTLNLDTRAAVGALHLFWYWAFEFAPDGDVTDFGEEVREAMALEADPLPALLSAGFLDDTGGRLLIHDWGEYVGKITRRRAVDAARKRDYRAGLRQTSAGRPQDVHRKMWTTVQEKRGQERTGQETHSPADAGGAVVRKVGKGRNGTDPEGFTAFWTAYPRKVEKPKAIAAWKALHPDEPTRAAILAGLTRWVGSPDWTKDGGQFIVYPERFLKNRRWEDEPQNGNGGQPHVPKPAPQRECRACGRPGPGPYLANGKCYPCGGLPVAYPDRDVDPAGAFNRRGAAETVVPVGGPANGGGDPGSLLQALRGLGRDPDADPDAERG
jgi:hypothetical protein